MLVAVTTCPRPGGASYLGLMLESLGRTLPPGLKVFNDVHCQGSRQNVWRALAFGGKHDRVLLLQDDVMAVPDLLERAAALEIPDDVGFVTGHDFGDDFDWQTPPPGLHKFPAHRFGSIGLCGAQCLIIPGEHAKWLAEHDMNAPTRPGPHAADYAIGWWTAQSPRPNKLVCWPPLVCHIGARSACWDKERAEVGAGIPHAGRTVEDLAKEPR